MLLVFSCASSVKSVRVCLFPSHEYPIIKGRNNPTGNIGAFSNLGVWDSEKVIDTNNVWFFCPPVVKGQLLGAGCVTFQTRLSLTIQGHPALQNQPEIATTWMKRILASISAS